MKISQLRKRLREENRHKFDGYNAQLRKETIELMRRRHAYYSKLINEAEVKTSKDFYDRFRVHFEMYGVELTLADDMSCCSIYLDLGDYDYERYTVINGKNDELAEVSPNVDFKKMFCCSEVNIFEQALRFAYGVRL